MPIEAQNDAERLLLETVKIGEQADVSGLEDKTVRAEFIRDMCVNPDDYDVHAKGVWLASASIEEALDLSFATLPRPLVLFACFFGEPPDLMHARAQMISFDGSTAPGLKADGLRIDGELLLRGAKINGAVRITGADIKGNFDCIGATLKNPSGDALIADSITAGSNVFLNNISAEGKVRFLGAKITGNLEFTGATLKNPKGDAFSADNVIVKGNVFLRNNFSAEGTVCLVNAEIMESLDCTGATFKNPGDYALLAQTLGVKEGLLWKDMPEHPEGKVSFHHAKAGQLLDDGSGWPEPGFLNIDGFTYDTFALPTSANQRLEWLDRMERKEGKKYTPQPYEQVVKVFREMGHERDARTVAIAKQDSLLKHGDIGFLHKLWLRFLGGFIAYGYKPWWAFVWMLMPILAGMALFWHANVQGVMVPSKERVYMSENYRNEKILPEEYPRFQPLAYSLDVFLPFVDLHQENYWLPNANRKLAGGFFRFYLWLHIAAGWFLSTIAVVGLTGVLKKD